MICHPVVCWRSPSPPGPAQGERLDRERYEQMLTEYYRLRGWDTETGIPTDAKRHQLGLD